MCNMMALVCLTVAFIVLVDTAPVQKTALEQLMTEVVSSIDGLKETELAQSAGQRQQSAEKFQVEERVPKESRLEHNYDTEPVKMHENFGEEDEPKQPNDGSTGIDPDKLNKLRTLKFLEKIRSALTDLNETEFAQAAGQGQQSAEKRKMEEHVPKESRRKQKHDTETAKKRDKSKHPDYGSNDIDPEGTHKLRALEYLKMLRLATIALNKTEFARAAGLKNNSAEKREVGGDRAPKESHRVQKRDTEPVELGLDNDGEGEPSQPDYDGKTGSVGDELTKAVTKLGPSLEDQLEELGKGDEEEEKDGEES
ncbi:hypothetical protein niasHT_039292 [Heterodera trifolii]|uniref:Effector protein n=1 Tax=Heterodera trifolii TaxID=157864 RepID=A0ABD2IY32_9BILA